MVNWKNYKLSDFLTINPLVSLKTNEGYSFIEMKDLSNGQKFAYPSTEKKLTGGARFEEGDTLFARITPCLENGKICQAKNLKNGKGFGSTEFLVFRGKKGISNNDFVFYLSRWDKVRRYAEANLVGTSGRQRVSKSVFEKLALDLPDLPTQARIASILSSFDDKIELNRRINQTLEQMSQALFNHYFVDNIDPDNLPEGWRWGTLKDITLRITKGTTPTTLKKQFVSSGINFLKVETLTEYGTFDFNKFTFIDDETDELLARSRIKENDILFSIAGTLGRIAKVNDSILPANTNQALAIIRPDQSLINPLYIYYSLKSQIIRDDIFSRVVQGVQANLSLSVLSNTQVSIPNRISMKEAFQYIDPLHKRIEANENEIRCLSSIRDTLLPKLMSGEIDVSNLNEEKIMEKYETENILNA